jgi:hypothetical protein
VCLCRSVLVSREVSIKTHNHTDQLDLRSKYIKSMCVEFLSFIYECMIFSFVVNAEWILIERV